MIARWLVSTLTAAATLSLAGCAVAPHEVEPARVFPTNHASLDCGELRYALSRAEARAAIAGVAPDLRGFGRDVDNTARAIEVDPWKAVLIPPFIALMAILSPAELIAAPLKATTKQWSAMASLSQAKGEADALRQTFAARGCAKWPPGAGSEIARFGCAIKDYDSPDRDRSEGIPNPATSRRVELILYERAIAYPDEPGNAPTEGTTTLGDVIDVSRSTPPDVNGRLTIVMRTDLRYPVTVRWDVFELRADDCGPMPAGEVSRANTLFRDWFASLAR